MVTNIKPRIQNNGYSAILPKLDCSLSLDRFEAKRNCGVFKKLVINEEKEKELCG